VSILDGIARYGFLEEKSKKSFNKKITKFAKSNFDLSFIHSDIN